MEGPVGKYGVTFNHDIERMDPYFERAIIVRDEALPVPSAIAPQIDARDRGVMLQRRT
jgi:hypothetical protein